MAGFTLGNFRFQEIIDGVATDFAGNILYYIDQFSRDATIETTAESDDIADKNGNIVRRIYRTNNGTFSSNQAFVTPNTLSAATGSELYSASVDSLIEMPRIQIVAAGATIDVSDAKEGTIVAMGLYSNGAKGDTITQGITAEEGKTFKYDADAKTMELPAAGPSSPQTYVVRYQRDMESGLGMEKHADKFPPIVRLTLRAAVVDMCSDSLMPAYIYIPSFQVDPSVTIGLGLDTQTTPFNGNMNIDYCGIEKLLYAIYFPDSDEIVKGVVHSNVDTPVIPDIPGTFKAALASDGLVGANAALSKTNNIADGGSVTVTITPDGDGTFAVAPTVTVAANGTAGTPTNTAGDGKVYTCEITGITDDITVVVSGEATTPTPVAPTTYNANLETTGLTGATAELAKTTGITADERVTLTITAEAGNIFNATPTVTADANSEAGNVTNESGDRKTYTCEISGFTADTTITVVGTAETE